MTAPMAFRWLVSAALVCLGACQKPSGMAPAPAAQDAGSPAAFALAIFTSRPDGGDEPVQHRGEEFWVESVARLRLEVRPGLKNYRVRVFDRAQRALASDDEAFESQDALSYEMNFLQALEASEKYTLQIDAFTGESVLDFSGRPLPDFHRILQVIPPDAAP